MINIKNKLISNKLSIGTWITLPSNPIAEILCNSVFDWITVDLEHSSLTVSQAEDLIRVIHLCGKAPLVRLTDNNSNQIKRVMDSGAQGIIVPMVNSEQEAKKAVSSTRYYPLGSRGVGLARAQKYGRDFNEYLNWQKTEPIVIVQIENKCALENLDKIFQVKGVDGYIIGPYDLSASLGCPGDFKNINFVKAINKIKKIGIKCKCTSGIHIVEPDLKLLKKAITDKFKFIAFSVDIRILDNSVILASKFIKNILQ